MKKRWFIVILAACLMVALLLPACAEPEPTPTPTPTPTQTPTPTPTPKPEPTTLKFSYTMPKGAAIGKGFEWWGPEFEKRTEGRYKVETYPGHTLVGIPAALDSVKSGVAEIVMTSTGTFERDFPVSLCTGLPGLGWDMSSVEKAYLAHEAQWEWINTVPEVNAEYKDFKLLWPFQLDSYRLFGNKEIHKAEDFNGLKVGGSGVKMEIVKENGGASVHVIPPQSYMNFDKGIIDVGFFTYSQVKDYALTEVAKYFYNQDFGGGCIIITMNWDAWNAMSPEDQKIMEDSWYDAVVPCTEGSMEDDVVGKQNIKDAGYQITYPTEEEMAAWEDANNPAVNKWMNDARSVGIEDPYAFLKKWKDIRAKYQAQIK